MVKKVDYFKFARMLDKFHFVFYKMWQIGEPIFDDLVTTACVTFDKDTGGFMNYHFNPKFWDELSDYERCFVICHEMLHVILNHGERGMGLNRDLCNIAMDIAINEMLLSQFGFDLDKLPNLHIPGTNNQLMIVDTVFKPGSNIPKNGTFEFYYDKLLDENVSNVKLIPIDSHMFIEDAKTDNLGKAIDKFTDPKEAQTAKEGVNKIAGKDAGAKKLTVKPVILRKRKWESVIRRWTRQFRGDEEDEQWIKDSRRNSCLSKDLFLPADIDALKQDKNQVRVVFFQDTSGSCEHLAPRFFKAACSFPRDRFIVDAYCFDTKVYKIDLKKGDLYGFGGTAFHILEEYIQSNYQTYPDAVFVITDGAGTIVKPKMPDRWYWFLSEQCTYCIPNKCNIFDLADFE